MEPSKAQLERAKRVADALDRGIGACLLGKPEAARVVEQALLYFDNERYRLLAWCIMPNHVHALVMMIEGHPLDGIVHSWKTFTARQCNRLLDRSGAFWARDYHDRFIRDESHLNRAADYIEDNPVKAGLVTLCEDWPWSSANRRRATGTADL
jgi:REP element-mobilizing transposase RayT